MPDAIPDELLAFIDANVESVEQLEILRVLSETPASKHGADDLARACQIQPSAIAAHLAVLEQRGLLIAQQLGSQTLCTYGAHTKEKERMLGQLLQYYKERPVTLIKLIYARMDIRLKAFADAFRLRKDS
jgi:DNA-binding transcriptional ArsR family regulator